MSQMAGAPAAPSAPGAAHAAPMTMQLHGQRAARVGMFLGGASGRRAAMAAACADLVETVQLADDPHQAGAMLALHQPDLLVLDLEDFVRDVDGAALAHLVAARAGAPTLLVCPGAQAGWLPALMAHGPCEYLLAPIGLDTFHGQVAAMLGDVFPASAPATFNLRGLLALRSRALRVLAGSDDPALMAARLCQVLASWPGLVHAAVFAIDARERLVLHAQAGSAAIDLGALVALHEPVANTRPSAFPALAALRSGDLVLADAGEAGSRLDALGLLDGHAIGTVVGEPIPAHGPGAPLGALSLMFDTRRPLAGDELLAINDIAQGAWLGLRLAEANREGAQLAAELARASTLDALTGVANRRHGEALLEKEIRRARRYALPLALISFDIDRFKDINDRYGHPCGDMALRTVANAAHAVLRGTDFLVRSGGEEFQVIATHTSAIDGLKMAEKIRLALAATPIPGCDRLTVSLGVAQLGEQESGDALTVRVNAAVARAKRAGRNCVELAMT